MNLANPHSAWTFYHSPGCEPVTDRSDGGFMARWPKKGDGQWDILHRTYRGEIPGKITVEYKISVISGTPYLDATSGTVKATMGIQLQRNGDDWDGDTWGGDGRFWCTNRIDLNAALGGGWQTLVCDTDNLGIWVNVWGKPATQRTAGFKALLANLGRVGLVCGGQSFAHGVNTVYGRAKIAVSRVEV